MKTVEWCGLSVQVEEVSDTTSVNRERGIVFIKLIRAAGREYDLLPPDAATGIGDVVGSTIGRAVKSAVEHCKGCEFSIACLMTTWSSTSPTRRGAI
jgi:hypothetical protein